MCGIVGGIAQRDIAEIILTGLQRLEYRGYDSAGIAVIGSDSRIARIRVKGKVAELARALQESPLSGVRGIGHTRWATHGMPSERNAHPHLSQEKVAVVHNGIIENFEELKAQLTGQGFQFDSETDTEVIAHLFNRHFSDSGDLVQAARDTAAQLEGAYALGILHVANPDQLIAIRHGSPLVIGLGIGENFIASDHFALLPVTQRFCHLEDGDVAVVTREGIHIYDKAGVGVTRGEVESHLSMDAAEKGGFRHYMLKEIMEQPHAIRTTLDGRLLEDKIKIEGICDKAHNILAEVKHIHIIACGTSYHAGLVAQYWLESITNIPTRVMIASEYRYHSVPVEPGTLFVAISQSGETADTLAALTLAKSKGYLSHFAICNVPESSLVRESAHTIYTRAGAEIGVASTKAFTTQLTVLYMMTTLILQVRQSNAESVKERLAHLRALPLWCEQVLELAAAIEALTVNFSDKNHALFIGRGLQYPIALEGALKLKEISYIHAEGYPGGELKHGPLALIDADMPVIVVMANDALTSKIKSNIQEVQARGGDLYLFADGQLQTVSGENLHVTALPSVPADIAPIVYTLPLQLLAYYVAIRKGTDVDQPRNLAKSVTVE